MRVGRLTTQLRARMNLSNWQMTDEPRVGLATAEVGMDLARRVGHHGWAARLGGNRGSCALLCGEWQSVLQIAEELDHETLEPSSVLSVVGPAAVVEALLGTTGSWTARTEATRQHLVSSDSYQDRGGISAISALASFGRGDLHRCVEEARGAAGEGASGEVLICLVRAAQAAIWLGDAGEADRLMGTIGRRGDTGGWLTATRRVLAGGRAALDGRPAAADPAYRAAVDMFRALDLPLDLGITLMNLRSLLGPGHAESPSIAAEARGIFSGLGAVSLLDRLERIAHEGEASATETTAGRAL